MRRGSTCTASFSNASSSDMVTPATRQSSSAFTKGKHAIKGGLNNIPTCSLHSVKLACVPQGKNSSHIEGQSRTQNNNRHKAKTKDIGTTERPDGLSRRAALVPASHPVVGRIGTISHPPSFVAGPGPVPWSDSERVFFYRARRTVSRLAVCRSLFWSQISSLITFASLFLPQGLVLATNRSANVHALCSTAFPTLLPRRPCRWLGRLRVSPRPPAAPHLLSFPVNESTQHTFFTSSKRQLFRSPSRTAGSGRSTLNLGSSWRATECSSKSPMFTAPWLFTLMNLLSPSILFNLLCS